MIKGEKQPAHVTHSARPISELRDPSTFEPPPRRSATGGRIDPPPPPYRSATSSSASSTASKPPPPSLPPRLPPRSQNSPAQDSYINQSAASRLGSSGVNVPDLGISPSYRSSAHDQDQDQGQGQGTSWAQKKSALQTVSSFQRDPSSVSLSDARGAASTANNFRERHGDQVARGASAAGELNQRYGVSERLGGGAGGAGGPATALGGLAGKKRPPPPPPPKKGSLAGSSARDSAGDEPPPLPMSTKPQF